MKEDAKNENYTKKICEKISNKIVIITSGGGKRQWLKAAKYGCTSWLSGVSNLNPRIAIDFYDYYKSNKKENEHDIENNRRSIFLNKKKIWLAFNYKSLFRT